MVTTRTKGGSKASSSSSGATGGGGSVHSSSTVVVGAGAVGTRSSKSGKHALATQSSSSSLASLDQQGVLGSEVGNQGVQDGLDALLPTISGITTPTEEGGEVGVETVEALSRGVATAAIASETVVTIPTSTSKKPIHQRGVGGVKHKSAGGIMTDKDNDTHSSTPVISNENGNGNENGHGNGNGGGPLQSPPSIGNEGTSAASSNVTVQTNSKSRRR